MNEEPSKSSDKKKISQGSNQGIKVSDRAGQSSQKVHSIDSSEDETEDDVVVLKPNQLNKNDRGGYHAHLVQVGDEVDEGY